MKIFSERTCLGCGRKFKKSELVRFCLDVDNVPVLDCVGSAHGRGGYCCRTEICLRSFFKSKKRLSRAFRREITYDVATDPLKIEKLLGSGSF